MSISSIIFYTCIYLANIAGFVLMGYDKRCAIASHRRIPEWALLLVSALSGAFGALCGMIIFRHKTAKNLFTITVPVLLLLQILCLAIFSNDFYQ